MTMLRPGEALYTTLSFPWPEDGLKDILVLDIGSHAPLKFLLNDTNAFMGVNSSSVQMTRLGHKGYPLVLFCRNLTEARAAMCAELFSMFR